MTQTPAADIVDRLCAHMGKADIQDVLPDCREAATEIEALRAREAELQALVTASEQERYAKCAALQRKLDEAALLAGDAFWNLPMPAHWDRDKQEYTEWCARQSKFVREKINALASIRGETD